MNNAVFLSLTTSAKYIGAGLATIGVVGAGAGIGIVFSGLLLAIRVFQKLLTVALMLLWLRG